MMATKNESLAIESATHFVVATIRVTGRPKAGLSEPRAAS
jgi:hypothetical protein